MAWNKETREAVLKISEGVLETVVDLAIFTALFGFDLLYETSPAGRGRPIFGDESYLDEAMELINYRSLKRAINNARKEGFIQKVGRGERVLPEVTQAGKNRLEAKIPFYDALRIWDGILYLVTYDIAERQKYDRAVLREKLLKLGCGMLQESVYITPYNPKEVLRDFIKERKLGGAVIISSVGKDGSIGEEEVLDLVYRIYGLGELNKRYKEYLKDFALGGRGEKRKDPLRAVFSFLAILQDDPQLPFELLPRDWLGSKAYKLYYKYLKTKKRIL